MKRIFGTEWAAILVWLVSAAMAFAETEQELIEVVQSRSDPVIRAEACKKLRQVGTSRCVPALSAVLAEERVGEAARYALEGMPAPEATIALREALGRLTGGARLGVIDSLGWRRDVESVPLLIPLLRDVDPAVAGVAASALGRVGGDAALGALIAVKNQVSLSVRRTIIEGLLAEAERLASSGRQERAAEVYRSLADSAEDDSIRVSAQVGLFRMEGEAGLGNVVSALKGTDTAAQSAALVVASGLRSSEATRALTGLLPGAEPGLQLALLRILQHRGDTAAGAEILGLAGSTNADVRVAVWAALGELGGVETVPVLLKAATSSGPAEQDAARSALVLLRVEGVSEVLMAALPSRDEAFRREIFKALSARGDGSVVARLIRISKTEDEAFRATALQTIGNLADGRHFKSLVQWLSEATDPALREELRGVFESMVERNGGGTGFDLEPLISGVTAGSAEGRLALFPVAALFAEPRLRASLRAAVEGPDERIRAAAWRAICTSRDVEFVPDLLAGMRQTKESGLRLAQAEGLVRLVTEGGASVGGVRALDSIEEAWRLARTPEEKRAILSGAGRVSDRRSLGVAEAALADPALRVQAEGVAVRIVEGLNAADKAAAEKVLQRLAMEASDPSVRTNAQGILKTLGR